MVVRHAVRSSRGNALVACIALAATVLLAGPAVAHENRDADHDAGGTRERPLRLLEPIPARGAVPPIVDAEEQHVERNLTLRADAREYAQQIRVIRHGHFGTKRVVAIREEGLRRLREFTDPAAFRPMIEELAREKDDVRLAVLDHVAAQGEEGQSALAWASIYQEDEAIRNEALDRVKLPASEAVLRELDTALRSRRHDVVNQAGALAGTLGALEAIPLLIFAQATRDPRPSDEGDLAWIAIQTQRAFVSDLVPVVGDQAGAFMPVLGIVNEGTVLRVLDAVVIVYRTVVHRTLVNLTTDDWGEPTEQMGYDMKAWWRWYNSEYVPFKNEQIRRAMMAEQPPAPPAGGSSGGSNGGSAGGSTGGRGS